MAHPSGQDRFSGTFVINRVERIKDEYTKTTDQVPFFLNTVGPTTLRGRSTSSTPYYSSLSAQSGSTGPFIAS